MNSLKPEYRLLLSSVKICPSSEEIFNINQLILEIEDWENLTKTAISNQVAPLFFEKIALVPNKVIIPSEVVHRLKQACYMTLSRNMLLVDHFRKIIKEFTDIGIPVIALKGIYLSDCLYKNIGLRQLSDIDLLVKEDEGSKCVQKLLDMGYRSSELKYSEFIKQNSEYVHYPPMILRGVSIELHTKLHLSSEPFHLHIGKIWEHSFETNINGVVARSLQIYDLLIYICIHIDKHFRNGKIQFTGFYDITNLLTQESDRFNWKSLIDTCNEYNTLVPTFRYILLANKYMNAPVPDDIITRYSKMMSVQDERRFLDYFQGNTFHPDLVHNAFGNIKNISGTSGKIKFIFDYAFPSKEFIRSNYDLKRNSAIYKYYFIRLYMGLISTLKYFFDNRKIS